MTEIFKSREVTLTFDDGALEIDIDYQHRDYYGLTSTPRGALDIATRIIHAVWVLDPEMAAQRVAELAKDIPSVYNLMQRHTERTC